MLFEKCQLLKLFLFVFVFFCMFHTAWDSPAQIAESVNDSANSSLVLGSHPTVSSRKIYFIAWLRAGWARMGVSVGGVLRQWSAYFRRGRMVREMFGWQPSVRQSDANRIYSRYPILREAGGLATVVASPT